MASDAGSRSSTPATARTSASKFGIKRAALSQGGLFSSAPEVPRSSPHGSDDLKGKRPRRAEQADEEEIRSVDHDSSPRLCEPEDLLQEFMPPPRPDGDPLWGLPRDPTGEPDPQLQVGLLQLRRCLKH